MTERVKVASRSDFKDSDRIFINIEGDEVGIIRYEGEYYAIKNECLHRSGPLCDGQVQRRVRAEWEKAGKRPTEYFSDEPTIACPWHGWEYDLESGNHLGDDDISVKTYDVTIKGDDIYLSMD